MDEATAMTDKLSDVRDCTARLMAYLMEYLDGTPEPTEKSPMATYTRSPGYLLHTLCDFHRQNNVLAFIQWLRENIPPGATVWDVGCASGFTGLTLALLDGYDVAFHDYDGLGLGFVLWAAKRAEVQVRAVPYDDYAPVEKRDWAVALDVIEHTGNHLGFVRWMSELGDTVAISFPHATYFPPYTQVLDEWVDVDGIKLIINERYNVLLDYYEDRTYMVFE
jgi:hypothetical protein